ncbi:MAG: glycoside hydrolase family 3 N-terminal domain-containing protein [Solirubrobacterales bacterium]
MAILGVACILALVAVVAYVVARDNGPKPIPSASSLSLEQLIGQRLVTGYIGTTPPKSILDAVKKGRIGGVTINPNNALTPTDASNAIAKLSDAARSGKQPPLFLIIDQEGGPVKRFPFLPPDRSAAEIGDSIDVKAVAKREGTQTGRALRRIGFNVNLAPVVDVPASAKSFLGTRGFSMNPRVVATAGCAFAEGLQDGGVAAVFKRFPGLGQSSIDTDRGVVEVTAAERRLLADLAPYRRCPRTPEMVLFSNASYPALDIDTPSALSPKTYDLLQATGFRGLKLGDAFGTPALIAIPDAPLRALRAGLDIVMFGQDEPLAIQAHADLLESATTGELNMSDLRRDAEAILRLKRQLNGDGATLSSTP